MPSEFKFKESPMPSEFQFKDPPPPAFGIPKSRPWYGYGYFLESPISRVLLEHYFGSTYSTVVESDIV